MAAIRDHRQVERSYCDCEKCKAACHTMPGNLAPGDLERIAEHVGVELDDGFLQNNFRASDGAKVMIRGEIESVPTIVPAQREDGRCVFLGEGDRCTIHPVAPYGCRNFKVCSGPEEETRDSAKSALCLASILQSIDYIKLWSYLVLHKRTARPMFERRAALQKRLAEIEGRGNG